MPAQIFMLDRDEQWTRAADPLTGTRSESWSVELLNNDDIPVTKLIGVTGGQFDFNVNAEIRGGGALEYHGPRIDWNQHRVQPWYRSEAGGRVAEWPLGVFIVATPSTQYEDTGEDVTLELYDKTQILVDDQMVTSYQVQAGSNLIDEVRSILAGAGQTRTAIEDSDKLLATSMVWPPGTSRLRIINDLLSAANYFSLWVDGAGVFRAGEYRPPARRGRDWAFIDDRTSIYSPSFAHDHDLFGVPNRLIVMGQSNGESEAPIAVAEDHSDGPFSIPTRGRVISRTEEGQEASDQDTLQAIADRLLVQSQQVGSTYQIKHAPIPLELNAVVGFRRDAKDIDVSLTVETISYSMDVGALCSTKLREFTA